MPVAILTPTARADIVEILSYLRPKSRVGARTLHLALHDTFQFLAENPGIGTLRGEFSPGIRSCPVGRFRDYLIFYRPISTGINVVRVIHGARILPRFFS